MSGASHTVVGQSPPPLSSLRAIGATPELTAADYEFPCKAGTAAVPTSMGLVAAGFVDYGTGNRG